MQSKNYFRAGQEADFKIPDLFVKLDEQEKQKTPRQVKSAAGGIIVLQGRVPKVGPLVIKDGRTVGDGRTVNDGHTVRDAAMIKDGRTIEDGRVRTDSETRKNFTAPVGRNAWSVRAAGGSRPGWLRSDWCQATG